MSIPERKNNIIRWCLLGSILIIGTIAMILVTPEDFAWTKYLREHRIDSFKDWMANSVFEGEMIGGSDLPVFVLIISALLYLVAWIPSISNMKIRVKFSFILNFLNKHPRFKEKINLWRPLFGFILASSLCLAMFINATKWTVGRARPKYVIEKGMAYSEWYEFGPYFVANGTFRGSFPSGHTGTVIILAVFGYLFLFNTKKMWLKAIGIIITLFTLLSSVLMLLARCMSLAHWVSDSVISIIFGLLIVHLLYFWILKMPEQREYIQKNRQPMPLPFLYELQLCLMLFFVVIGAMAVIVGLRALYLQSATWFAAIVPVGAFMIFYFLRLLTKLNPTKVGSIRKLN